jgi:hypothetical protein
VKLVQLRAEPRTMSASAFALGCETFLRRKSISTSRSCSTSVTRSRQAWTSSRRVGNRVFPMACDSPFSDQSPPPPRPGDSPDGDREEDDWIGALEALFEEALLSYYEGSPMFTEAEFQTLRDELEYLGSSHVRLGAMEKVWVLASQERDFDRRVRKELDLTEDDLNNLKSKLIGSAKKRKRLAISSDDALKGTAAVKRDRPGLELFAPRPALSFGLQDADVVDSSGRVSERIRWLLFGDAFDERLKIVLLYLPAVVMSFVTATFFTVLFALLDGEMHITLSSVGRVRLGIMSYIVVTLTVLVSNKVTPATLEFLDLGKPQLMRGNCPNCNASVSCLFTGSSRVRDERKCKVCGAVVGFNSKWRKVYLVAPPGARRYSVPD